MQEDFQSRSQQGEWFHVTHPKAVKFLKDPERSTLLAPFMERPRCLSEVARQRDMTLGKLHYEVQQLVGWGLLKVAHCEKRKGRPVKFYVAAPALFVSYALLDDSPQDLFIETELAILDRFAAANAYNFHRLTQSEEGGEWGRLYRLDPQGGLEWFTNSCRLRFETYADFNRYLASDGVAPYMREMLELHLRDADAKAFQRELVELTRRYRALSFKTDPAEEKTYQFRVCFLETPE